MNGDPRCGESRMSGPAARGLSYFRRPALLLMAVTDPMLRCDWNRSSILPTSH